MLDIFILFWRHSPIMGTSRRGTLYYVISAAVSVCSMHLLFEILPYSMSLGERREL